MTIEGQQQTADSPQLIPDKNPTSATDTFNIGRRGDGAVLLRLVSSLPDNTLVENHRTLITAEVAKALLDTLCSLMDYYPKKTKSRKKE